MSAETFDPIFDRITDPEQRIHGVETAAKSILRIKMLITEHQERLKLEKKEKIVNLEIINHLHRAITELKGELEDQLDFLKEFDPALYQILKDI